MAKKKIGDYIAQWIEEFGPENGFELHRSEFVKEGSTWYLRVFVDKLVDGKYDYVGSDDCEKVSRYLSSKLDEEDPIEQNYYLEVSSPGMDRPLISDKDYERFCGSLVDIKLYKAIDGKKNYQATLVKKENDVVTVKVDDNEMALPLEAIAKINLAVVF